MTPNPKMPIVELSGVSKQYALGATPVNALSGIDLKIFKGDFLALSGPSGSGKSTLLNLIGLLDTPSSGEVRLDNQRVDELDDTRLAPSETSPSASSFRTSTWCPCWTPAKT